MPHSNFVVGQTLKTSELAVPAASIHRTAALSIVNATFTKIAFDGILFDHGGNVVLPNFVCPKAGVVQVNAHAFWNSDPDTGPGEIYGIELRKNDAPYKRGTAQFFRAASQWHAMDVSSTVDVIAGNTLSIWVEQHSGGSVPIFVGSTLCWADFHYVGIGD